MRPLFSLPLLLVHATSPVAHPRRVHFHRILPLARRQPPQTAPPPAPRPTAPQIDMARAKRAFDNGCAGCHGPDGIGGKGPRLAVPKLRHAATDEELGQVIMGGIPRTGMPPSWYLGSERVILVSAYVRMLGANATPPRIAGDVARGRELFLGKGACERCHTIGAEGHAYGPDLSDIGVRRGFASLRDAVTDPNTVAKGDFVPVRAITREREKIAGIRLNEDNFTIQILDPSGRLRSFRKELLSELQERSEESAMPSYKAVFSEAELQNLVAFLSSLRGEQ